jgi:prophage antirepressor-like protein
MFNLAVKLENGEWVFDTERVAKCLGITTVAKSGNACVRWSRVNEYLKPSTKSGGNDNSPLVAKGDFIPEPAVYKLAFKASNEVAEKFQNWLATDVLPQLRQTGKYETGNVVDFDKKLDKLKLEKEGLKLAVNILKPSKVSTIKMLKAFNESQGLSVDYLPEYVDEETGKSATELLKKFNLPYTARKFNKIMMDKGFLEERTRKSTNKQGYKRYKVLTEKGLKYGKNVISSRGTENETQPLYYESTFMELANSLSLLQEVM